MSNTEPNTENRPKKKRNLMPWQTEDAERLKAIFSSKKKERNFTETSFAEDYFGGATQGAVNQYINGTIPLNLEAVLKFSVGLGCKASDISPTLANRLQNALSKGVMDSYPAYSPAVKAIADIAESLDFDGKKALCESAEKEKRIKDMKDQIEGTSKNSFQAFVTVKPVHL